MITVLFDDRDLKELIETGYNRKYRNLARDKAFMRRLITVYNTLTAVETTNEYIRFSFLHYEKLKHVELSSVRVMPGRVERILFREQDKGIVITILELDSTHYGNKK
ncbi:MAG: hypothetical protein IJ528_10915 [Bacteroidaceae bacterium]|nr:hypothetical protein [Bacteroidaceae bacterium]